MTFSFQPLRVGGGGFVTGLDIAPDGTKVCRCDSFGAYIYSAGAWQQLCTTSRLPIGNQGPLTNNGVYEIRIAPSNSNIIYMFYGAGNSSENPWLFVSTNKGMSFVQMTSWTLVAADGHLGGLRGCGPKAAVNPNSADNFVTTTDAGTTLETTNGTSGASATFSALSTVPTGTTNSCGCVAFDPGTANVCYVSSWGNGLYLRTSAGNTFSLVTGTAGKQICRLKVAGNGNVFFGTGTLSGNDSLWRLTWSAGPGSTPTVTNITPASLSGAVQCFVLDPSSATHITAMGYGAGIADSTNSGTGWSAKNTNVTSTAADAPYLITGSAGNNTRFSSEVLADPNSPTDIYFSGWQGMFKTAYPIQASGTNQACTSVSLGIEQLATNGVIVPSGFSPLLLVQDWGVLQSPGINTAPTSQGWDNNSGYDLSSMWHADYAGSTIASVVSGPGDQGPADDAVSVNGGATWARYAVFPNAGNNQYGTIAVTDATHWIQVSALSGNPYRTANGGAGPWTLISNPAGVSVPTTMPTGWITPFADAFAPRRMACSDRVTAGTFYMWNYIYGLFRSTDNGVTWNNYNNYAGSSTPATMDVAQYDGFMKSVPNNTGHLFFCNYRGSGGSYPGPTNTWRFWRSTDGGQTWSIVGPSSATATGAIIEVWAFGFGATAPGQSYPAIYFHGWVYNGSSYIQGVYQSIDNAVTWTKLCGPYPDGWTDWVRDIAGDPATYGTVYFAKSGSSFSVMTLDSSAAGPTGTFAFSVIIQGTGRLTTKMVGY